MVTLKVRCGLLSLLLMSVLSLFEVNCFLDVIKRLERTISYLIFSRHKVEYWDVQIS